MKTISLLLAMLVVLSVESRASDVSPPKGFTALFNGKDLSGWKIVNDGQFVGEEGVIKLNRGGGWLCSDEEYDDFVLLVEVRWLEERQDSGFFLRAGREGKNWPDRKYEVQCENSERVAHIFGAKCERDAKKAEGLLKPTGEWNAYEIHCAGTCCDVKLNGEPVSSATGLTHAKGYLGIQGESGVLEFRNFFIRRLKGGEKE